MKQSKMDAFIVGLFIFLMMLPLARAQQNSENVSFLGRWPYGSCFAVFVVDDVAYIGNGGVFEIVDVSNPNFPTKMGEVATPSVVRGIYVVGNYAYIADGPGGLRIYDVSNSASINEVGHISVDGEAKAVFVLDHFVYLADKYDGLRIIDVSTPSSPVQVGALNMPGQMYDVFIRDGYAYVAAYSAGMIVVDVSTPSSPSIVAAFDTDGHAYGITLRDRYAYVADGRSGLHILDISAPAAPAEIGFLDTGGSVYSVAMNGRYAYVADWDDGLRVIDVNAPETPTEVARYDPEGGLAIDVAFSNDRVYIADLGKGMRIIDASVPNTPVQMSLFRVSGFINDVVSRGRYLYLVSSYGLNILDIGTPSTPTPVSILYGTSEFWGIDIKDRYAYVAAGPSGLSIVDINDPAAPTVVSAASLPGKAYDVVVRGQYAYVAANSAGLRIVDVSDPGAPVEAASFNTGDYANHVAVLGQYAYVTGYDTGLHIIDISTPTAPTETAFFELSGGADGLKVQENYIYIANGIYGLRIIDVSTPSSPVEAGFLITAGFAIDVFVRNSYAYVMGKSSGLRIVDISSPTLPVEAGFFRTAGQAISIYAQDQYMYAADRNAGLYILQNDLLPPPAENESKLTADDGMASDWFGRSAAIDGDYAVVGAPNDDNENGDDAGAAYVYRRDRDGWVQQARLLADDGAAADLFGYAVDISDDFIVVGACWDDDAGEKSGAAYVFRRDEDAWVQKAKIVADDAGEDNRFGISTAIDGDNLIVGAFFDDDFGSRSGSAYIFKQTGGVWVQQARLLASDAAENDWFGVEVDIHDGRAVVGARYDDNENGEDAGAVYVFRQDSSTWNEEAKLLAGDGQAGDLFHKVSISGDWIAVGAYQDDDNGANSGSVYLFHREGGVWVEASKLTPDDGAAGEMFGCSVALDGGVLAVGAYRDDDNGINSGSAYIYEMTGGEWGALEKVAASYGDRGDYFGASVGVSANKMIVGARNDDYNGENAGAAYVYRIHLTPKTIRVPAEYTSISEAMTIAGYGDTVLVAPGTYPESFTMNEGVVLSSEEGAAGTIISAAGVSALVTGAQDAVLNGFTIAGNDNGQGTAGNGVYSDGDNLTVRYCIIRGNRTGIYLNNASHAQVYNNTIVNNSSKGLYMQIEPSPRIYNNIISGNVKAGIYRNTAHSLGAPFIQYNCYFGNGVDFGYYGSEWTPAPGAGDLFEDPLFVNAGAHDFHLSDGSPCIDAGDPAGPNDPDGSRADMGALTYRNPTGVLQAPMQPQAFRLYAAYPNPFNPTTTIAYDLPQAAFVELTVHNVLGREICRLVHERKSTGRFVVQWDGKDNLGAPAVSGLYFYRIKVRTEQRTIVDMGKMILMK